MDSGSSGSIQSSSGVVGGGGGDEYDSRGDSISSFLNHNQSPVGFGSITNQQPPLISDRPTFFDPPPHTLNLEPFQQARNTNNVQQNNEMVWARGGGGLRSEPPSYQNLNSSSSSSSQSLLGLQRTMNQVSQLASSSHDHHQQQPNVGKNPKKRSRASRRTPTTVLATDTTNFRQMVQEFTGIPTAPFSATSSSFSRRLDLFSTAGSSMRANQIDNTLGKLQSSSPNPLFNNCDTSILNMQNQLLNFHSSVKLPLMGSNESFLNERAHGGTSMASLDEIGLTHQPNLGGFSGQGSSEARNNGNNIARWRDGGQVDMESFDGNGQNVGGFKLDSSSSSSDFNPAEKVLDNNSSGGLEFTNYK